MKAFAASLVASVLFGGCCVHPGEFDPLEQLLVGNERYRQGRASRLHEDVRRRMEVSAVQHPFAIIVACADSRVPPEIVFDQGLGDLFVIRNAGHVIDEAVLGSVEFGVAELGAELILVMGHERCGAVTAARAGGKAEGHIGRLVAAIAPGIAGASGPDPLDHAIRLNALAARDALRKSDPILKERVARGELRIEAARYDLEDGRVEILE